MMLVQIMFWAILGHFIGDYLGQTKEMAIKKSQRGWVGAGWCVAHCLFYSGMVLLSVAVGTDQLLERHAGAPVISIMVFLTHYPIDRWSLADKWLRLIKGRQLEDWSGIVPPGYENIFDNLANDMPKLSINTLTGVAAQQSFAAIVYTVVDNTMHIILMTAGFAALLHWGVI